MTENAKLNIAVSVATILVIVAGFLVYNYFSKVGPTTNSSPVGRVSSKILCDDFYGWVRVIEDKERGVVCWIISDDGIYCIPESQLEGDKE